MYIRKSHLESMIKYCFEQAVVSGIETLAFDKYENQQALTYEEQLSVLQQYMDDIDKMPDRDLLIK